MTDTTPTTPLDLDAAVERMHAVDAAGAEVERLAGVARRGGKRAALDRYIEACFASSNDVPALVEEVERLRVDLETKSVVHECCVEIEQLRAERDAAIARAEALELALGTEEQISARIANERDEALAKVAAGLADLDRSFAQSAVSNDPHRAHREAVDYVKRDVRRALTEVQAGAQPTDSEVKR